MQKKKFKIATIWNRWDETLYLIDEDRQLFKLLIGQHDDGTYELVVEKDD